MYNSFYNNIAFPWVLIDHTGNLIQQGDGTLFQSPRDVLSNKAIDRYKSIKSEGWSLDNIGWAIYAKSVSEGFLILPGLKIIGLSRITGKAEFLHMKLSKDAVETHVSRIVSFSEFSREEAGGNIRTLIHEIRTANAAVKNAAYELFNNQQADDKRKNDLSGNILALSEILSARLDTQDILSAYTAVQGRPRDRIQVYKKFDKLIRCYTETARQKRIKLEIQGRSEDYIRGPDIFEIVPFLLIENAIKYAPDTATIICNVSSKDKDVLSCSVESLGPKIDSDETMKIFEPRYRGRYATKTSKGGDGLGLAVLKTTVELYGGQVSVQPAIDPSFEAENQAYYYNRFVCTFPIDRSLNRFPQIYGTYPARR